jgi:hypothetical protein
MDGKSFTTSITIYNVWIELAMRAGDALQLLNLHLLQLGVLVSFWKVWQGFIIILDFQHGLSHHFFLQAFLTELEKVPGGLECTLFLDFLQDWAPKAL